MSSLHCILVLSGIFIALLGTVPPTEAIKCYVCKPSENKDDTEKCFNEQKEEANLIDCNAWTTSGKSAFLEKFYGANSVTAVGLKPKENTEFLVEHWLAKFNAATYTRCRTVITGQPQEYYVPIKTSDPDKPEQRKKEFAQSFVVRQCAFEFEDDKKDTCYEEKTGNAKIKICSCKEDGCNKESGKSRIDANFKVILAMFVVSSTYFFFFNY